jgi:SWI/SNF-related matrix-associated actin-dependent regulator of chromatin subfamily A member 5
MFFRTDDYDLLATDIQEKTPKEVKKYYLVFTKKWKQLAGETRSYLCVSFP